MVVAPLVATIPLAIGAGLLFFAVHVTRVHFALKRRGITVPAPLDFRTADGAAWYEFTDVDGVEHGVRGEHRGPVARIAYDPEDPEECSFDMSVKRVLLRAGLSTLGALPLLGGGVALAVLPFLVE